MLSTKAILIILFTLGLVSCSPTDIRQYEASQALTEVAAGVTYLTLGAGDFFEVKVYGEDSLSGVYRVSNQGEINFPLIGKIPVDGLTPSQVETIITKRLADGFLKKPYVTIIVKEFSSKKITVTGEVKKAGTFTYAPGMTVVDGIAMAGGLTEAAVSNSLVLVRPVGGRDQRFEIPLRDINEGRARNFLLQPGDSLFVPKSMM